MASTASQRSFSNFAIKPQEIEPEILRILQRNRAELEQLLSSDKALNSQTLLFTLEAMNDRLHQTWALVEHLHKCSDSAELRTVYKKCLPLIENYKIELKQNPRLYQAIKAIADSKEFKTLPSSQQSLISYELREFKMAGIDLMPDKKARYALLKKRLSELNNLFDNNVRDATEAWIFHTEDKTMLAGLTEDMLQQAAKKAQDKNKNGWMLTIDFACYFQTMTFLQNRKLREELYRGYNTIATKGDTNNTPIMEEILKIRHEMANLLGFPNHASYSTAKKTVGTPEAVLKLVEQIANKAKPIAEQEILAVKELALQLDGIKDLQAWDLAYYSEKLLQKTHRVNTEELRNYFPLKKVLAGLFEILNRLYGITFLPQQDVPTWHPDVYCFDVFDANKQLRGTLYMDLFTRPNKAIGPGHAFSLRQRRELADGSVQHPIAVMVCNLNAPVNNKVALVTPEEVQVNIFHEMGHCLQLILTQVNGVLSSFESIPWDAIEFPSHFLEYWAKEKAVLKLISGQEKTGEPIPEQLIAKLADARNFQSGMEMVAYLEKVLFDLYLHLNYDPNKPSQIQSTMDEARKQVAVLAKPDYNQWQNRFTHAFAGWYNDSYSAGYYSYLWSDVLAADAFSLFTEKGIFDRKVGTAFLTTILETGGSRHPRELFKEFRGHEPSIAALLKYSGLLKPLTEPRVSQHSLLAAEQAADGECKKDMVKESEVALLRND